MHPDRVARLFAILGIYLLLIVLGLRVVSLVTITWQERMGMTNTVVQAITPAINSFTMSADGRQVIFQQQVGINSEMGWFRMPFEGGPAMPAEAPETTLAPFRVSDNQLYLQDGDGYSLVRGSERDTRIGTYVRSPDAEALAFTAYRPGGNWGLYVLQKNGKVNWLGDQDRVGSLSWAPDSLELAFTAVTDGTSQIFVAGRDGQNLRQLTHDTTYKSRPRWSPDGSMVAYIASTGENYQVSTPTPTAPPPHGPYQAPEQPPVTESSAIAVINRDGTNARKLLEDNEDKFDLAWGTSEAGPEVVFARTLSDDSTIYHLYGLDPTTGKSRQVYPPQKITALDCPATIPGGGEGTVRISIANSSLQPANVHVMLRARMQRFPSVGKLNASVVRSENVQVAAGAVETVEWPVAAQSGLTTHISALINPGTALPMDEERCAARNVSADRLHNLPNLPYLSLAPPLSAAGLIFCVPWLLKRRKPLLWLLYLCIPLLVVIIILIEDWIVRTRLS